MCFSFISPNFEIWHYWFKYAHHIILHYSFFFFNLGHWCFILFINCSLSTVISVYQLYHSNSGGIQILEFFIEGCMVKYKSQQCSQSIQLVVRRDHIREVFVHCFHTLNLVLRCCMRGGKVSILTTLEERCMRISVVIDLK